MRRKSFALARDVYYIKVKTGAVKITIKRKEKKDAVEAYYSYEKTGKDVEWCGLWDGKKFQDVELPSEETLEA